MRIDRGCFESPALRLFAKPLAGKHMKKVKLAITLIFISSFCLAQTYIRIPSDYKDSLIQKFLYKNSSLVGRTYEFTNPNYSYIIYFEIKPQDTLPNINTPFDFGDSPYSGRSTVTLFNLLFSVDRVNYTKYTIDTVDVNSGCCPCHHPDIVDSLLFTNEDSKNGFILFLTHPVSFNCNSVTSYYQLFYDNFETCIAKKEFPLHPIHKEYYYPFGNNSSAELIKIFRKLKSKQ